MRLWNNGRLRKHRCDADEAVAEINEDMILLYFTLSKDVLTQDHFYSTFFSN